eukprot:Pompholyxophrys_punicea_v1_NODE_880_length_1175_cov_2.729464.p1 type:complete len:151 gc:universal NODE_880_length_1175_cov_2.729464:1000-548(-)
MTGDQRRMHSVTPNFHSCVMQRTTIELGKSSSVWPQPTASLWIQGYPWYYMPQAVHALLHAWEAIKSGAYYHVPIGWLTHTEESSESANKSYKYDRQFHARKVSREATMTDVTHMRLAASDPFINNFRTRKVRVSFDFDGDLTEIVQTFV